MADTGDFINKLAGGSAIDEGGQTTANDVFDVVQRISFAAFTASGDSGAGQITYGEVMTATDDWVLVSATVLPSAAVTANDTNFSEVWIQIGPIGTLRLAASASTETSGSGGTGNWVAGTPFELTVSSTLANRTISNGEIIRCRLGGDGTTAGGGDGVDLPASEITLRWRRQ